MTCSADGLSHPISIHWYKICVSQYRFPQDAHVGYCTDKMVTRSDSSIEVPVSPKNGTTVTETHEYDDPIRDISGDVIDDGLRRGLKGRQFMIIALGSIIGPGCFYGLGYGIYEAGPLGLLIGFSVVGMLINRCEDIYRSRIDQRIGASVWILMQSVGEVATLFPVHGGFVEVSSSASG
jgi:amino acid transporter